MPPQQRCRDLGRLLALGALGLVLAGCASPFGSTEYKCKAPDGVPCMSVEEAYRRSTSGEFHGLVGDGANPSLVQEQAGEGEDRPSAPSPAYRSEGVRPTPTSGTPIRSQPRVMRVWVAPWEDKEGDLHDQSYVWVTIDGGRWQIDHTRRQVRQAFKPVLPPLTRQVAATQQPRGSVVQQVNNASAVIGSAGSVLTAVSGLTNAVSNAAPAPAFGMPTGQDGAPFALPMPMPTLPVPGDM